MLQKLFTYFNDTFISKFFVLFLCIWSVTFFCKFKRIIITIISSSSSSSISIIISIAIIICRKINNTTSIVLNWFVSILLPQTFIFFRVNITILYWIIHRHYCINLFSIVYICVVYFAYAISKWSTILKYCIFVSIIWDSYCSSVCDL